MSVVARRPPRRRRPGVVGLVVFVIILALLVVAAVAGEAIARSVVTQQVQSKAATYLKVPSASDVSVDLGSGSILLQLAKNRLDSVQVRATHADIEGLDATVSGTGAGIPVFSQGSITQARLSLSATDAAITKRLEAAYPQLKAVNPKITLAGGHIAVGISLSIFGQRIPVTAIGTPGVKDGNATFAITSAKLGENAVSVAQLERVVPWVSSLFSGTSLCIADQLPKAVKLTSVAVGSGTLTYGFDADGIALTPATLNDKGTCS